MSKFWYGYIVHVDISNFFGNVNQDKLMAKVAAGISDKRVLRVIGGFLRAGALVGEALEPTLIGTPQGGPLSPILANIYLDELDKEMEKRGYRFIRYADDIKIFSRSERAAHRTLSSTSQYLERNLRLKTNRKSQVTLYPEAEMLGYMVTVDGRITIHPNRINMLIGKVGNMAASQETDAEITTLLQGWLAHYHTIDTKETLNEVDTRLEGIIPERPLILRNWHRHRVRFTRKGAEMPE